MRDDFSSTTVSYAQHIPQSQFARRLTPVPLAAGADIRLSAADHQVLENTSGYSDDNGWCWLTQAEHAAIAHRNRKTIARVQNHLTRLGYLLAGHNLYDPARHRKRQTVYRVTDPSTPNTPQLS